MSAWLPDKDREIITYKIKYQLLYEYVLYNNEKYSAIKIFITRSTDIDQSKPLIEIHIFCNAIDGTQ